MDETRTADVRDRSGDGGQPPAGEMPDGQPHDEQHDGAHPAEESIPKDAPRGSIKRGNAFTRLVREVIVIGVTALVISFIIKTFLAQAFWIPSGSMEETLVYGDRVMVSKIQAGPLEVDRGDIVVFEDPGGWLPPTTPTDRGPMLNGVMDALQFIGIAPVSEGSHLIKRVIGLPGDTVACCDELGRMSVNGQPLEESGYLYPGDSPSLTDFEVTVPQDRIWVMGDHRSNSRDSRANDDGTGAAGSVPADNVVGQAFVLLFPLDHLDWFTVPDTFEQVPEPAEQ